ncbi:MAG: hypothetical protein HGB10_09135 [Coriobacteriia bacterium]|nr:hypothetical protein [Coriobacteriia bacterium]
MSCRNEEPSGVYGLVSDLFCAGAVACALYALHRIARGILLEAEVKAFGKFQDAYTPEEREVLIHKIKVQSLRH